MDLELQMDKITAKKKKSQLIYSNNTKLKRTRNADTKDKRYTAMVEEWNLALKNVT